MIQPVYINRSAAIHATGTTDEAPWLPAIEPDYKGIITNATLRRRMSRIVKMGVACGLECIDHLPSEEVDAIITATGLGCLADTEKFLNAILDNEEQLLNPTPFIQSTFNTIGAQIALIRQIYAYNMTYVHRGLSFESALLDGMMKIWEGNRNILVGGIDEITPVSHTIQQRLGLLRNVQAGEGAHFFLLGHQPASITVGELAGISTFTGKRTAQEAGKEIHRFLQQHQLTPAQVDWFVSGKNGNPEGDALYTELEDSLFASALCTSFKDECGEYPTASSYAVWKVISAFEENQNPCQLVLIYNHYQSINHSLILIRRQL